MTVEIDSEGFIVGSFRPSCTGFQGDPLVLTGEAVLTYQRDRDQARRAELEALVRHYRRIGADLDAIPELKRVREQIEQREHAASQARYRRLMQQLRPTPPPPPPPRAAPPPPPPRAKVRASAPPTPHTPVCTLRADEADGWDGYPVHGVDLDALYARLDAEAERPAYCPWWFRRRHAA